VAALFSGRRLSWQDQKKPTEGRALEVETFLGGLSCIRPNSGDSRTPSHELKGNPLSAWARGRRGRYLNCPAAKRCFWPTLVGLAYRRKDHRQAIGSSSEVISETGFDGAIQLPAKDLVAGRGGGRNQLGQWGWGLVKLQDG